MAWDSLVRNELSPNVLWYAQLNRDATGFTGATYAGLSRRDRLAVGMKRLCEKVRVPYEPPHKLRHGHAEYSLKQAQDVADLKAVGQNLMHASLTTTDSIYSVLTEKDVGDRTASLGENGTFSRSSQEFTPDQLEQLRELLASRL